jgi:hypothetical protein
MRDHLTTPIHKSNLGVNIYFLTMLSSVCSMPMLYAIVLGPLLVLVPWCIFYVVKRQSTYFNGWTWATVINLLIITYPLAVLLCVLYYYVLFTHSEKPLIWIPTLLLVISNLLYSAWRFIKNLKQRSQYTSLNENQNDERST